MKHILLVGSGAREHAILRVIKKSKQSSFVVCFASHENPGIAAHAEQLVTGDFNDKALLNELVDTYDITDAVIGPEAPLEAGMTDALRARGVKVFGPTKALARIETSKAFARELAQRVCPGVAPKYNIAKDLASVDAVIEQQGLDVVIKAGGLMGGKGVYVSGDHFNSREEALAIADKLFAKNDELVIEQKLFGEEFSLISVCDGKTLKHFPLVQDNKRAYVSDEGPNTGGMGSVSFESFDLPFIKSDDVALAKNINEKVIFALQQQTGELYQGVIYGGYMLTSEGVKLIEFNARFGDPECLNLLHLLDTDFLDILEAVKQQKLSELSLAFKQKASVCKYAVPVGYPVASKSGSYIEFDLDNDGIYCGHIKLCQNKFEMLGSRAIACVGVGDTVAQAERKAQALIESINGEFAYRIDIGSNELIDKRVNHMRALGYAC